MKRILHSDTSWTFLKLNTLTGLVAIFGHSDIIATHHFTPFYDVTIAPKQDVTATYCDIHSNLSSFTCVVARLWGVRGPMSMIHRPSVKGGSSLTVLPSLLCSRTWRQGYWAPRVVPPCSHPGRLTTST